MVDFQTPVPAGPSSLRPAPDATPDIEFTVYGIPGPQGSKSPKGTRTSKKTGRQVPILVESSKKVKPWREAVRQAGLAAMPAGAPLLEGPLAVAMVFTTREQPTGRPTWWPRGQSWSKAMRFRPATTPDLSKLVRSTEDALTKAVWTDDGRVVSYRRLEKFYVGHDDPDVLDRPGAVIRVWRICGAL